MKRSLLESYCQSLEAENLLKELKQLSFENAVSKAKEKAKKIAEELKVKIDLDLMKEYKSACVKMFEEYSRVKGPINFEAPDFSRVFEEASGTVKDIEELLEIYFDMNKKVKNIDYSVKRNQRLTELATERIVIIKDSEKQLSESLRISQDQHRAVKSELKKAIEAVELLKLKQKRFSKILNQKPLPSLSTQLSQQDAETVCLMHEDLLTKYRNLAYNLQAKENHLKELQSSHVELDANIADYKKKSSEAALKMNILEEKMLTTTNELSNLIRIANEKYSIKQAHIEKLEGTQMQIEDLLIKQQFLIEIEANQLRIAENNEKALALQELVSVPPIDSRCLKLLHFRASTRLQQLSLLQAQATNKSLKKVLTKQLAAAKSAISEKTAQSIGLWLLQQKPQPIIP